MINKLTKGLIGLLLVVLIATPAFAAVPYYGISIKSTFGSYNNAYGAIGQPSDANGWTELIGQGSRISVTVPTDSTANRACAYVQGNNYYSFPVVIIYDARDNFTTIRQTVTVPQYYTGWMCVQVPSVYAPVNAVGVENPNTGNIKFTSVKIDYW